MTGDTTSRTPATDEVVARPVADHGELGRLVRGVRHAVSRGLAAQATADEVGEVLRPALAAGTGLLRPEQRVGSPDRYTQHLLHAEPDGSFSVVALVWLPGQATPVHDHVSWCTVGVLEGCETEVRYRLDGPPGRERAVEVGRALNPVGAVSAVAPPGDVHRVLNSGRSLAVSLHVYGVDIAVRGSGIRRVYEV